MPKPYLLQAVAFSMATIFFVSCLSPSKYAGKFGADARCLPKDFNPSKHILLVAQMPRLRNPDEANPTVTRKLDEALKKYCPYKYEIASLKDIYDKSKYADTSVYKYAILSSLSGVTHTTTTTTTTTSSTGTTRTSVSPSATTTEIDFYMFDRTNSKRYAQGKAGSSHIDYAVAAYMGIIKKTVK